MFSDSESLAFVEEESDVATPMPQRLSSANPSPQPPKGADPPPPSSLFVAPSKKNTSPSLKPATPANGDPQHSHPRVGRSGSMASISFQFEDSLTPDVPVTRGPRIANTPPRAALGVDNNSIAFHVEDSSSGGPAEAVRPSSRRGSVGAPAVANDSIAFHFEDDWSHGSAQASYSASPVGRPPTGGVIPGTGSSIVFHDESATRGNPVPPNRRSAGSFRPDASLNSIQFSYDTDGDAAAGKNASPDGNTGGHPPMYARPPSVAGSSVSATVGDGAQPRKTVVSNHLKNSSARSSPARVRPSPKISPDTHPPLCKHKPSVPAGAAAPGEHDGRPAMPTTPAEAAAIAKREKAERMANSSSAVEEVRSAHSGAASRSENGAAKSRHRRHTSTKGDGEGPRRHRRRRSHHSLSSAGAASKGRRSSDGTDGDAPTAAESAPQAAGPRQVSESIPDIARTHRPAEESGAAGAAPQLVNTGGQWHNDPAAAGEAGGGGYLPHGLVCGEQPSPPLGFGGPFSAYGARGSATMELSNTFLFGHPPPPPPARPDSRGWGHHGRTGTNTFVDLPAAAEAARQAEEWQAFNEQQRAELQRLQRRIDAARRQDRTLLSAPAAQELPTRGQQRPKSSTAAGPSAYAAQPSLTRIQRAASRQAPPPQQRQQQQRQRPPQAPPGRAKKATLSPVPRRTPPPPHAPVHADDAARSVAGLLGVLWPPSSPTQLYFVTGSRLTPQQVDSFYDTVTAQQRAGTSGGERPLSLSSSPSTGPLAIPPADALRPRSASSIRGRASLSPARLGARSDDARPPPVRRSRVLRAVFDFLDLNRRGLLIASDLPAVQHLLETELAKMAVGADNGAAANCTFPPPRPQTRQRTAPSLLTAAAAEHDAYTSAYTGLSRGLSVATVAADGEPQPDCNGLGVATRRALLMSFAVNVVIPLVTSSRIHAIDFPTLSLVVFNAIDKNDPVLTHSPQGQAWRQIVSQYFEVLSS